MDQAGDESFPCAGFPLEKDRGVHPRRGRYALPKLAHRPALTDEVAGFGRFAKIGEVANGFRHHVLHRARQLDDFGHPKTNQPNRELDSHVLSKDHDGAEAEELRERPNLLVALLVLAKNGEYAKSESKLAR